MNKTSRYALLLLKAVSKRDDEDRLFQELKALAAKIVSSGKKARGWGIRIDTADWRPIKIDKDEFYSVTFKFACTPKRAREQSSIDGEMDEMKGQLEKSAPRKGWRVEAVKAKDSEKSTKYVELKGLPKGWMGHFSHLYKREDQIGIVMSAIKAGIQSNWEKRFHTVLFGPPACLSGDTIVTIRFNDGIEHTLEITLSELHKKFHTERTLKDWKIWSMSKDGSGFWNELKDVVDSGDKEVIEIVTDSGRKVKATHDHEFLTPLCQKGENVSNVGGFNKLLNIVTGLDSPRVMVLPDSLTKTVSETIVKIRICNDRPVQVYDIVCADPQRNFVANGFVVHNCGKTDLLGCLQNIFGEAAILKYDATATTEAGAIKDLDNRLEIPRIGVIEELEKVDEKSMRWLLGVLDHRAEIRKVNFRQSINRSTKMVWFATVNDYPLFKKALYGAVASRFANHVYCPPPDLAVLKRILHREVEEVDGKMAWADKALEFAAKWKITDPRKVTSICLCGGDDLLKGHYQKMLEATMATKARIRGARDVANSVDIMQEEDD